MSDDLRRVGGSGVGIIGAAPGRGSMPSSELSDSHIRSGRSGMSSAGAAAGIGSCGTAGASMSCAMALIGSGVGWSSSSSIVPATRAAS